MSISRNDMMNFSQKSKKDYPKTKKPKAKYFLSKVL